VHHTLSLEVGSFNILGKPLLYLAQSFVHQAGYIFWFCLDLIIHSPSVLMYSPYHLIHSLDLFFYSLDLLFLQSGPPCLQSRPSFLMSIPLFVKLVPLSVYCIPVYSLASTFKICMRPPYALMGPFNF